MVGDEVMMGPTAIDVQECSAHFAVTGLRSTDGGEAGTPVSVDVELARDETVRFGRIELTLVDVRSDSDGMKVRLGLMTPKDLPVHRREVWEAIRRENRNPPTLE